MKSTCQYLLLIILFASITGCFSDYSSKPDCRVENGRIIFKLYNRWSDQQKRDFIEKYDLDSNLIDSAFIGEGKIFRDSVLWEYKSINKYFSELSKPFDSTSGDFLRQNEVLIINDTWIRRPFIALSQAISYGVNNFRKKGVFKYEDGYAQFWLPGYKGAEDVYLSGTFNDWSTMKTPMMASDSGWSVRIKLEPGKYLYKYIVNGKWGKDPNNLIEEEYEDRRMCSVVFCYNHRFVLKGKDDARRVAVTGNFINWSREGFKMNRSSEGWYLDIYLREGTYTYKFIADGEWVEDKANPDNRLDANGNLNSFFLMGEQNVFRLSGYTDAEKVIIAGSFNKWRGEELVMLKDSAGWQLPVALAPGNYEYKFVVDGKWITDPSNPLQTGEGDYANSFFVFKPNYTFVLDNYGSAKEVILAGSFTNWGAGAYRMIRKEEKWILPTYLKPGKYLYKYIVDGSWILDPANELFEANEYGTNNSVLWIER
jgi:hypothetical protein